MDDKVYEHAANVAILPGIARATILTGVTLTELLLTQKSLVDSLYRQIPAGVGSTGAITLDEAEKDAMLTGGARWAVEGVGGIRAISSASRKAAG